MKTRIITHRGLDPDRPSYFEESSLEAFRDQLGRGYGIEFDVRFTKDNVPVVIHDTNLERITSGKDARAVHDIDSVELFSMDFNGCHIASLSTVLELISTSQKEGALSAMHLKHDIQKSEMVDTILKHLVEVREESFMIFDVTLETAKYIKSRNPNIAMATSVAHPYDIERYNASVGGTLLSIDEAIMHKNLFEWAWLDEWDLANSGSTKTLYNEDVFSLLHLHGFKIVVVSPELHATSPGLLGGESHPDAASRKVLKNRIQELAKLHPDAICTDYPDAIRTILGTESLI